MLKFRVEKLEDVEEQYRELYAEKEVGGKKAFYLKVDGVAPAERVQELQKKINDFRSTNIRLKENVAKFADFAGITDEITDEMNPEEVANLLTERKAAIDAEMKKNLSKDQKMTQEEIDAKVAERVKSLNEAHKTQVDTLTKKIAEAESGRVGALGRLEDLMIQQQVIAEATKRGLKPTANIDIVTRAKGIFKLLDNKVRALDSDGNPIYGSSGIDEITIQEWVEAQATKDAPHLFESNSGGGATGGSASGRGGKFGANPYKKESYNRTQQMVIEKNDPNLAKRLKAEAGVR